jgi:hypothetical protein
VVVEEKVARAGHMGLAVEVPGHSSQNRKAGMDEVETVDVQPGGPPSFVLTHMRIWLVEAYCWKEWIQLSLQKEG